MIITFLLCQKSFSKLFCDSDLFRRLQRAPVGHHAGDARAADNRRRGADALYPRRVELGPPDGHGDGSLRAAHGQRQPPHLAIDASYHCRPILPTNVVKHQVFIL